MQKPSWWGDYRKRWQHFTHLGQLRWAQMGLSALVRNTDYPDEIRQEAEEALQKVNTLSSEMRVFMVKTLDK